MNFLVLLILLTFQFHKGAIRTILSIKLIMTNINFNSIKVRLELNLNSLLMSATIFQFHKGAIRTVASDFL